MYNSYLITAYFSNITLLLLIRENDYRQGLDYNILNIHLSSIFITYLLFLILVVIYILEAVNIVNKKIIIFLNHMSLLSAITLIVSGSFWSWSQWGTIQLYDMKILVTLIIVLLFFTVSIIFKISKKTNILLCFYNIYVLYHLPLLKYNVIWNSEIHQKNTFQLIDFFMVNYNSWLFIIFSAIVIFIVINQLLIEKRIQVINI